MNAKFLFQGLAMAGVAALTGCALVAPKPLSRQQGESVVFIGEEPAALAWCPAPGRPLEVRSSYLRDTNTVIYEAGRDYVVDCQAGTLRRTAGSRLPDFRTNMLFGQEQFDHSRFPGFGNNGFFAFVDYEFAPPARWPVQEAQGDLLKGTLARLRAGQPVRIIAYGDSITAGGDATKPQWVFWRRWADELQRKYPRARIEAVNGATGGDSTVQGLQRLQAKVLDLKPDLVLIGFGMNDHNINGVPIAQFEANLQEMIGRIRAATGAEVVLFSAFPPNPKWKYGSHRMEQYAAATRRAAAAAGCAYADVFSNWEAIARRKKPEDLLGNNINHPNDFGHWIYFQVLDRL